mmetsp:Transcript_52304/g.147240  ORF Transcript_52304/g.147240 Transcript_52304/m.147240 type:complete len:242 (-) Transcript_52304:26-751(-)
MPVEQLPLNLEIMASAARPAHGGRRLVCAALGVPLVLLAICASPWAGILPDEGGAHEDEVHPFPTPAKPSFLAGTTELYDVAMCQQTCAHGPSSESFICCDATRALCCPAGSTCSTSGCVGAGYGTSYSNSGTALGNPIQALLRFVRDHLLLIWLVVAVLSCLGIGGHYLHSVQSALLGMSVFNALAPAGLQHQVYGDHASGPIVPGMGSMMPGLGGGGMPGLHGGHGGYSNPNGPPGGLY